VLDGYTISSLKRAKACSVNNLQTIVETVPNTTTDLSQLTSLAMRHGFTFMSPRKIYITKYG
jgi:hypothetical protein